MSRPGSESDGNGRGIVPPGVPIAMDFEDTGPIRRGIAESVLELGPVSSAPITAHDIAGALKELMGTPPPPPPSSPPIDLKKLSKKNWLVNLLIGLVVAGAGSVAAYKATEVRSIENREDVDKNAAAIKGNSEAIGELTGSVDKLSTSVGEGRTEQAALIKGVGELKEEAQTDKQRRLEEKLLKLERENRRLERENR
jgi:hypothetical protein